MLNKQPRIGFQMPFSESNFTVGIHPTEAPQFYKKDSDDFIDLKFKIEMEDGNGEKAVDLAQREIGSRVAYLNDQ